jgi:type I restriction enzyme R subunit
LLNALIRQRKKEAIDYKAYLAQVVELTKQVSKPESHSAYPGILNSPARRALFDNLGHNEQLAVAVDTAILNVKKADWRGHRFKEREVRMAIKSALGGDEDLANTIFEIVKNQRDY